MIYFLFRLTLLKNVYISRKNNGSFMVVIQGAWIVIREGKDCMLQSVMSHLLHKSGDSNL